MSQLSKRPLRGHVPLASALAALVYMAVMTWVPVGASAAMTSQLWTSGSTPATWTCSFSPATGILQMDATETGKPTGGYLPIDWTSQKVAPGCPGAEGTDLALITEIRVGATRMFGFGVAINDTMRRFGKPLKYTIVSPEGGTVWFNLNYVYGGSKYQGVSPTLTSTSTGLDYSGDGVQDISTNARTWNVEIAARGEGGIYDLREVPADPADDVDQRFGSFAPVTFYGPRSGPNITYLTESTSSSDSVTTYGGDDTITTGSGNDVIDSGAGDDAIFAGKGDDKIHAGAGNDWVGASNDSPSLVGGSGIDRTWLGPGNDYAMGSMFIWGEAGRDILMGCCKLADGGSGSDFISFGSRGTGSVIRCGAGIDYLPVGIHQSAASRLAALRRTHCERPWTNIRQEPFHHAWWPTDQRTRMTWCAHRGSYVYVCSPDAASTPTTCIPPSRC